MSTTMANDDRSGSQTRKNAATYGKDVRKRPFSSAFPHRYDDKPAADHESRESQPSRPAKVPPNPKRTTDNRNAQQNVTQSSGWDPYDILDMDSQPKPKMKPEPPKPVGINRHLPHSMSSSRTRSKPPDAMREESQSRASKSHGAVNSRRTDNIGGKPYGDGGATGLLPAPSLPRPSLPRDEPIATQRRTPVKTAGKERHRLIDVLADQANESSASDSGLEEDHDRRSASSRPVMEGPTATPPRPKTDLVPSTISRSGPGLKSQGVKRTYGSQRSMLRDASLLGEDGGLSELEHPFSQPRLPSPSKIGGLDFGLPEDMSDDEAGAKGAIRSIHELRQAGANNRFAHEMDDLVDRIGVPSGKLSSMRRNALVDLGTKMCTKGFVRQLRDHGINPTLFANTGREEDIISGFALVSALLALLSTSVDHHLATQLRAGGFASLLKRVLGHGADIVTIGSQRRMNLPRSTQASISTLKASVLRLPVWEGSRSQLSPRRLALKFIDTCCKPTRPASGCLDGVGIFAGDLFSVLEEYLQGGDDLGKDMLDCHLAASILEAHSATATEEDAIPRWTWPFLPVTTQALSLSLEGRSSQLSGFGMTMLKLAMNSTNNNPSASEALVNSTLFADLAEASCVCFDQVKADVEKGLLNTDGFNRLVLILGVMINFCEHGSLSRPLLEGPKLDRLVQIYLRSHASTKEVSPDVCMGTKTI